jgi:hypothetical protein
VVLKFVEKLKQKRRHPSVIVHIHTKYKIKNHAIKKYQSIIGKFKLLFSASVCSFLFFFAREKSYLIGIYKNRKKFAFEPV